MSMMLTPAMSTIVGRVGRPGKELLFSCQVIGGESRVVQWGAVGDHSGGLAGRKSVPGFIIFIEIRRVPADGPAQRVGHL